MINRLGSAALVLAVAASFASQRAEACGCFAPPDPTVPILQAGERILFGVENGTVTAHIQIQYAGEARDFGWLLPLPSVPQLELGTEALFTQLIAQTQPRYVVQTRTSGNCGSNIPFGGLGSPTSVNDSAEGGVRGGTSPLVTQASIGPYDFAVLKADSKDLMFKWLTDNHYFIPTGTDQTVGPYIHEGAYFLALKLKSGKSAGDIQPVVLHYASDNPMIPIVLTSVAAQPNMGIQVWMLGNGRAIPRNYNHVVINDAQIDWLNQAQNYNDVVIRAVAEAPEKHAFITEYSGSAGIMARQLYAEGQFASVAEMSTHTQPGDFVGFIKGSGFGATDPATFFQVLTFKAKQIMLAAMPRPTALSQLSDDQWLDQMDFYLGDYRTQNPSVFEGYTAQFDASVVAAQLDEGIVQPAKRAQTLLDSAPTLTRLYTTLSPQDMTRDPVFSFNYALPSVSNTHTAIMDISCGLLGGSAATSPATLTTEQGWKFDVSNRSKGIDLSTVTGPSALRIETLPEEGSPVVLLDNTSAISIPTVAGCTCNSVDLLGLGAFGMLLLSRRRKVA